MSAKQPVVFLSHGAGPSYYLDTSEMPVFKGLDKHSKAADFLRNFVKTTGMMKPEVILVISAHWEETKWTVNTNSKHSLYYDYYNFPPKTYKLEWTPLGAPDVASDVKKLLEDRGIPCNENSKRGLDHGVFVPLKLVYPEANIPVCQISLLRNLDIKEHLQVAEILSELRKDGVLIIGSGFATHKGGKQGAPPAWASEFKAWLNDVLTNDSYTAEERKRKLLQCLDTAPHIDKCHPRIEHFLPLLMCCAAANYSAGRLLYSEFVMESLLNEHYMFI